MQAVHELDSTVQGALQDLNIAGPSSSFASTSHHPDNLAPAQPSRKLSRRQRTPSQTHTPQMNNPPISESECFFDLSMAVVARPFHDGLRSFACFTIPPAGRTCLDFSDIGFLAASSDATLLIADMRGPEVLLVDSPARPFMGGKSKGKHKLRSDPSPITSLTWTISPTMEGESYERSAPQALADPMTLHVTLDHDHNPRLIVVQASGYVRIFELANVGGSWILADNVISFDHDSVSSTFTSFVLDKTGQELKADPANLQRALSHQNSLSRDNHEAKGSLTSLWVTVTPNLVSTYFNIDGPRTAQYEERETFESAEIVWRFGCPVLMVASKSRKIYALSLPDLVPVARMAFDAAIQ